MNTFQRESAVNTLDERQFVASINFGTAFDARASLYNCPS